MAQLIRLGANCAEVQDGKTRTLFSYDTPVAVAIESVYYVTGKHWSTTTSRHINEWLKASGQDRKGARVVDQEAINKAAAGNVDALTQEAR